MRKQQESVECTIAELRDFYLSRVMVKGTVLSLKRLKSKKGDEMGFFTFEDKTGVCEVVLFPAIFSKCSEILNKNRMVEVRGQVEGEEDDPKIIAEEVFEG